MTEATLFEKREVGLPPQYDGVVNIWSVSNFISANIGNDGVVTSLANFTIDSSNKINQTKDWIKDPDGRWTGYIGKVAPESSLSHRLGSIAADVEKDWKEWASEGKPGDFREWRIGRIKASLKT